MTRRPPLRLTRLDDRLAPAGLDPTFGDGGVAELRAESPDTSFPGLAGLFALPGGEALVVGQLGQDLFVDRLTAAGTPDPTFGTGGRATVTGLLFKDSDRPFDGLGTVQDAARTPDGGVVLVATGNADGGLGFFGELQIVKLTRDGTLDAAFTANANGGDGFDPNVQPDGSVRATSDSAAGVAVGPDGRIVIVGTLDIVETDVIPPPPTLSDETRVGVLVLRPDGTPDPTFDGDGRLAFDRDFGFAREMTDGRPAERVIISADDVAVDTAGRVLIAGSVGRQRLPDPGSGSLTTVSEREPFAVRLTPAGGRDTGFDGDGLLTDLQPGPGNNAGSLFAVPVADAGVLLVTRRGETVRLTRLAEDGTPDAGFGTVGVVELTDSRRPADVALGRDGTVVLATQSSRLAADTFQRSAAPVGVYRIDPAGRVSAEDVPVNTPAEPLFALGRVAVAVDTGGRVTLANQDSTPGDSRLRVFRLADRLPTVPSVPADLDGDRVADVLTTNGPRLSVRSGADGRPLIAEFAPFEERYTGTLNAVLADLDADGRAELVVGPDQGGGPVVAVYRADGTELTRYFGLDDPAFRGGLRLAAADTDGNGTADLIVAAGVGGGPRVAVYDGVSALAAPTRLRPDFFAFPGTDATRLRDGAFVSAGDLDADGKAELVFGGGPGGAPRVRILSGDTVRFDFFAGNNTISRNGALAEVRADGVLRVVAGNQTFNYQYRPATDSFTLLPPPSANDSLVG